MAFSWLLIGFFLYIAPIEINAQGGPPKVTGSYRATGETVETLEDSTQYLLQVAFEESYDAKTKNAAYNIWIMGSNSTFIENFETKQTFVYSAGKTCMELTVKDWIETKAPPSLLSYEDTNGTVRFSLKQLFSLDDKYLKESNIPDVYRDIPVRKWMYEIIGKDQDEQRRVINVYAYWSDPSWKTTSSEAQVPVAYVISKFTYKQGKSDVKLHEQFINVFGFVPNTIDHRLFEPVQGVICPNRKQTLKFPDVSKWQAVALHSEVIFPDYKEINYIDVWFDPLNKLMRQDIERIKEQPSDYNKNRKYQSEMVLGKYGVVYRITYYKGQVTCDIINIPDYDYDLQNLIDFKAKQWSIGSLFGINTTTYTYIGKTSKRDMPCYLFQGVRKDWPEPSAGVESLWEWCFSTGVTTKDDKVLFRNGEYGLVSAQIRIMKSGRQYDFPENYTIYHHFYDVNLVEPALMDATYFDIGRCFEEGKKRRLQFEVDWKVTDDSIFQIENATSDLNFLKGWKSALYTYSKLDSTSLRITNVKAVLVEKKLVLKFTILDTHPDDNSTKTMIDAFQAEKNIRESVKNKEIKAYYRPPGEKSRLLTLGVVPKTVKLQLNPNFEPHKITTTTTVKPTTRKKPHFTLIPDPDDNTISTSEKIDIIVTDSTQSVSSSSTPDQKGLTSAQTGTTPETTRESLKDAKILHTPGTVAGVSIAMLVIGITIGASGVFIKTNGLPPFLKCGR